jgi:uncharacterized protein
LAETPHAPQRLDIIDALRGSALFGILLLHAVEHWDFVHMPQGRPAWLQQLDDGVIGWAYFLFGGKAYAIFALLFGVSFFIALQGWQKSSRHASGRFLWRLAVLAAIGYVHGLLFCGDILTVIAALGVPLVLLNRLPSRALGMVAVLLLLQLPQWGDVWRVWTDPAFEPTPLRTWALYSQTDPVYATGSLADVIRINTWTGQAAKWWWVIETYRYPQMLGLFVCGLLMGRSGVLHDAPRLRRLAWRALAAGAAGFALMWLARRGAATLELAGMRRYAVDELLDTFTNLAQTAIWAGGFVLLYQAARARAVLGVFVPYGRMSLSGYTSQALFGVPFFYGFGLGMYRVVGPFYAVFFGLAVFVVQCTFAHWWMKRFRYGPLEWVWRAATLRTTAIPMRRADAPARLMPPASVDLQAESNAKP